MKKKVRGEEPGRDGESRAHKCPQASPMNQKQKEEVLVYFQLDDLSYMDAQAVVEMVTDGLGAFRTRMKKSHPRYWRKYEAFVLDDTENGLLSFFKKYQEGLCKVPNLTDEVRTAMVEKYSLADMKGNGELLDEFKVRMANPDNFERNKSVYKEMDCFNSFQSLNGELRRRMTGEFIEKLLVPLRPKKKRGPSKMRSPTAVADAEVMEKRCQFEARAAAEAEADVRAYKGAKRGRLRRGEISQIATVQNLRRSTKLCREAITVQLQKAVKIQHILYNKLKPSSDQTAQMHGGHEQQVLEAGELTHEEQREKEKDVNQLETSIMRKERELLELYEQRTLRDQVRDESSSETFPFSGFVALLDESKREPYFLQEVGLSEQQSEDLKFAMKVMMKRSAQKMDTPRRILRMQRETEGERYGSAPVSAPVEAAGSAPASVTIE